MSLWNNDKSEQNLTESSNHNRRDNTPLIVMYWNAAAGVVVGLPILLFLIVRIFSRLGGEGGQGGEGWFGRWMDGPEEERWQGVGSVLANLWALAVFGVLVWRGNRVLQSGKDHRSLFVATVMLANLAFLCFLLVTTRGGEPRGGEEEAWMGNYEAVTILTYLFMTVFGVAFSLLLHDKARRDKSSSSSSSSSYSLFGDNRKADDDGIMIG